MEVGVPVVGASDPCADAEVDGGVGEGGDVDYGGGVAVGVSFAEDAGVGGEEAEDGGAGALDVVAVGDADLPFDASVGLGCGVVDGSG